LFTKRRRKVEKPSQLNKLGRSWRKKEIEMRGKE
tara:strand:+ start:597 stop:698 length:102 start_codon:yes stop_codon:yes gene_type:complete